MACGTWSTTDTALVSWEIACGSTRSDRSWLQSQSTHRAREIKIFGQLLLALQSSQNHRLPASFSVASMPIASKSDFIRRACN